MDGMKSAAYKGHIYRSTSCFLLILALTFASAAPLYAVPEDDTQVPGVITIDLAPEIEIDVELDALAIDSDEARELLAQATPAQRAELERLYAQLDEIDRETEIAVEEYNAARMRLEQVAYSIEVFEQDIMLLKQAYEAQAQILGARAVEIYKGGREIILQLILEAQSLSDLMDRINYANRLSTADAELMARIRNQRSRLETTMQQLVIDESEAASLEFEMRARMIEVRARNEDRKEELREHNFALLQLLEATQVQSNLVEQELAYSINDGTNEAIIVVPGEPAETAMALRGVPYLWGGSSRDGFDCSGLMLFIFAQHGVDLPHHSGSQVLHGQPVVGALQPADLLFFGSPIHHVAMYVGGGYFIHAPRTGDVVRLQALANRNDMVAARRLDWQPREGAPR